MRSLVGRGALEPDAADRFMRSIHTVASDVIEAMVGVADGKLDEDGFLRRYGHLRPGTYDILSYRYDERPDLYLGQRGRLPPESENFELTAGQRTAIASCLAEEGFAFEPDLLLSYISAAIIAREESKFAFSRGVSDALVAVLRWGDECGLSRDELSHLDISDVLDSPADPGRLREKAMEAAERHLVTRAMRLPHLIVEPDDLDVVRPLRGRATFITGRSVTAPAIHLASSDVSRINGRIVLIESADPGYDWIFSHEIVGLVTKFGGTNSHMAIRCAEFALPAAIGCGERLFSELLKSPVIELDCANRRLIGH